MLITRTKQIAYVCLNATFTGTCSINTSMFVSNTTEFGTVKYYSTVPLNFLSHTLKNVLVFFNYTLQNTAREYVNPGF